MNVFDYLKVGSAQAALAASGINHALRATNPQYIARASGADALRRAMMTPRALESERQRALRAAGLERLEEGREEDEEGEE